MWKINIRRLWKIERRGRLAKELGIQRIPSRWVPCVFYLSCISHTWSGISQQPGNVNGKTQRRKRRRRTGQGQGQRGEKRRRKRERRRGREELEFWLHHLLHSWVNLSHFIPGINFSLSTMKGLDLVTPKIIPTLMFHHSVHCDFTFPLFTDRKREINSKAQGKGCTHQELFPCPYYHAASLTLMNKRPFYVALKIFRKTTTWSKSIISHKCLLILKILR